MNNYECKAYCVVDSSTTQPFFFHTYLSVWKYLLLKEAVYSHFVNSHFVNSHLVNSHFVDSHLVNVDKVGIDKVGRYQRGFVP